jgi:hypothetical protein
LKSILINHPGYLFLFLFIVNKMQPGLVLVKDEESTKESADKPGKKSPSEAKKRPNPQPSRGQKSEEGKRRRKVSESEGEEEEEQVTPLLINKPTTLSARLAAAKNKQRGGKGGSPALVLSPTSKTIRKDKPAEVGSRRASTGRKAAAMAATSCGAAADLVAAASKRKSKEPLPPQLSSKNAAIREKVRCSNQKAIINVPMHSTPTS